MGDYLDNDSTDIAGLQGDVSSIESTISSLGNMAYEDLVEKAKLGTTVISGGYIVSSLLLASDIIAKVATVDSLAALKSTLGTVSSAKFTGSVQIADIYSQSWGLYGLPTSLTDYRGYFSGGGLELQYVTALTPDPTFANAVSITQSDKAGYILVRGDGGGTIQLDGANGVITADDINATTYEGGTISSAEFGYINGVTSSIQTQIDGKAAKSTATSITVVSDVRSYNYSGSLYITQKKTRTITINSDGSITFGTESAWTDSGDSWSEP